MWSWLVDVLRAHPELAIFLTLALGFLVGRLRYRSFTLGSVTGTLLAGVLVGQLDIAIPDLVKTVAFIAFLFALGYQVGPQFFAGLRKGGVPQLLLALISCVIGLGVAYAMAKALGYGPGWGAGLLAGGLTQSSVIGTAGAAINQLNLPADVKQEYVNQIPVGYAVCYLVGTAAAAYFLSRIAPRMVGTRDLAAASHALEGRLGIGDDDPDLAPAYTRVVRRVYRIEPGSELDGTTVGDAERASADLGHRVFFYRYQRDGKTDVTTLGTVLRAGDEVTVTASHADFTAGHMDRVGTELDAPDVLSYEVETLPVVVTDKRFVGKRIGELRTDPRSRLLFVRRLVRAGVEVPFSAQTVLHSGDELLVQGPRDLLESRAKELGYPVHAANDTDMSYVGLGIVLGGLIGIPALTIAGEKIGLSTSGGALIMGLLFGWLRGRHPTFGRFPAPAQWLMNTGGLCLFVGIVGISSGPDFIHGVAQQGVGLVLGGLVVTLTPMIVCLYLGKWLFRFDTPVLLGVIAGANTTTASIGAITETARSQVPVLGYTVPYALGNTLLTIWGTIIVALLA
ncbi:aspartate-alanine antiporter [Actinomadura hibisca]|uniref:aspartate-alanine antiporter n=1 Tax=Actinomadura hibisca TaxID=68565 RepID=UPI000830C310|nr:aspartate-alanine antiporter [Actinomadura hibisca]